MDSKEWQKLCRQRVIAGDYDPLWKQWNRMRQIKNKDLLEGIPNHWSHPVLQEYMQANGWDVGTIPKEKICELAERIKLRLTERGLE